MMKLHLGNTDEVLVWNVDDIVTLRSKYRIVGKLIGSHPHLARQNQVMTRPLYLNQYETTLLLEKEFACLVKRIPDAHDQETMEFRQKRTKDHLDQLLDDQRKLARDQKIADIEFRSDVIVAGILKKKGVDTCTPEERHQILSNITDQIKPIHKDQMLVQQPIESIWTESKEAAEWSFPCTESQRFKYTVFKDLWQQDFMLTCGAKFGGDFLIYPGDPELYHAKYVAICQQTTDTLTPTDTVQIARLASNVKKTALLCSVDSDTEQVTYTKLDYNPK